MKQIFLLTTLSLALAVGAAQARTVPAATAPPLAAAGAPVSPVAIASTAVPAFASQAAPAQRAAPRKSRTRGKGVPVQRLKICNVQATAEKGEGRTAALSTCIKQ
ncbi:PsiF family protein [Simplicispira psychrophila]|uniref:PsiF family protein n=1 Tax=Simplicispira psychrophila TaxID=80882 RepID=UPI00048039DE|nr:PsiF family protein [Simplicispira psychrophila]